VHVVVAFFSFSSFVFVVVQLSLGISMQILLQMAGKGSGLGLVSGVKGKAESRKGLDMIDQRAGACNYEGSWMGLSLLFVL
jgi:hypothetical protein